jgi:hypothetical protein
MDPRQSAEISAYLRGLADQIEHPTAASAQQQTQLAEQLRELADRRLVALPAIDPQRDDLGHWIGLSDHRLRSENHCDAWNLAAGLFVQADRADWGILARRDAT